jgi:hypothetical protein
VSDLDAATSRAVTNYTGLIYRPATIMNGGHTTSVVRAPVPRLRRILVPEGTAGDTLLMLHGLSEDGPFYVARDRGRAPIRLLFTPATAVEIEDGFFADMSYVQLRTADFNGETAVPQSAARTFQLGWAEA